MNFIFGLIVLISVVMLIFTNPNLVLSSMLSGGEKALNLTVNLVVIYAVWLGIFALAEKSGLNVLIAKLLKPFNKFLFGTLPDKANEYISLNLSANLLGMSGATTPMGIKSILELDKYKNTDYAVAMFFIINATSVQLIPSSVLALRVSLNSSNPTSIILPTVLATLISSIVGILLCKIFIKKSYV